MSKVRLIIVFTGVVGIVAVILGFFLFFNETENQAVRYELLLFTTAPTGALNDNAPNDNPLLGEIEEYRGRISFPQSRADGATVATTTLASPSTTGGLPLFYKCSSSDVALFGVLITLDAYTQTATDDIRIYLYIRHLD